MWVLRGSWELNWNAGISAWQHEAEQEVEAVREVGYRCPLLPSLTLCLPFEDEHRFCINVWNYMQSS